MKLYGFNTSVYRGLTIFSLNVIKETEKTYVVQHGWGKTTIRKETMSNIDDKYFTSEEEAKKGLCAYCEEMVEYNERRIKNIQSENKTYQKVIEANKQ